MNTANDSTRLVDDLAGHWTDPALGILKSLGIPEVSIDVELETWKTLKNVLQAELRQQLLHSPESVDELKATVLHKATLLVAQQFAPWSDPANWKDDLQFWVAQQYATATERALYFQLVRQSATKAPSRLARWTDSFPRFQVLAVRS